MGRRWPARQSRAWSNRRAFARARVWLARAIVRFYRLRGVSDQASRRGTHLPVLSAILELLMKVSFAVTLAVMRHSPGITQTPLPYATRLGSTCFKNRVSSILRYIAAQHRKAVDEPQRGTGSPTSRPHLPRLLLTGQARFYLRLYHSIYCCPAELRGDQAGLAGLIALPLVTKAVELSHEPPTCRWCLHIGCLRSG